MRGILKFLELEKAVRWCRGFSALQIKACNKLWRALRDDISQNSLYRVIHCLLQLGLEPMIKPDQLQTIVTISQGSDLALLWFLWEAHYKWPRCAGESTPTYSYNEQLLLTAIAHLDLPMTLRGLDEVLPPPQHRKPQHQQKQTPNKSPKRRPGAMKCRQKQGKTAGSAKAGPYFEAQPRPQPFTPSLPKAGGKTGSRIDKPPIRTVTSAHENLRWFANYEVSPIKAEVRRCLSAALDRQFRCMGGDPAPEQPLCEVHRMMEHTMQRRKQELTVAAIERCMNLLDVPSIEQRERSNRIVRQLEHEVLMAAEKLKQEKERQLFKVGQMGQQMAGRDVCQMCVLQVSVPVLTNNKSDPAGSNHHKLPVLLPSGWNTIGKPLPTPAEETVVNVFQWGQEKLLKTVNVGPSNPENCPTPSRKKKPTAHSAAAKPAMELNVVKDVQPESTTLAASSSGESHCFRSTKMHGAPIWNYFRIYEPLYESSSADPTLSDMQSVIRGYCIAALHKAMQGSDEKKASKVYGRRYIERLHLKGENMAALAQQAAHACAKRHFASESSRARLNSEDQPTSDNSGGVKVAPIDPNNRQTLLQLLKSACETLKKDTRYVLVTLPNAHMLPMLVDWAEQRYGKSRKFSQIERVAQYPEKVYELIQQHAAKTPLPEIRHIRYPTTELIKRATDQQWKQIQQDFYKVHRFRALEQSRLLWLVLHNYSKASPISPKTFFAYMPPRPHDIFFPMSPQY